MSIDMMYIYLETNNM